MIRRMFGLMVVAGAGYATVSSDYESLIDHRVDVSNKSINGDADTYTYVYTYDE